MRLGNIRTPLLLAVVFIALAFLRIAAEVPGLIQAVTMSGLDSDPTAAALARYVERSAADLDTYKARFNGRSLFFKPKPPPPKPKPAPPQIAEGPKITPSPPAVDTGPPPPPATYQGPSVMFVLGDEVWFHGGLRLSVGQEKDGVKVLAADPPWSVRLGHMRGEYTIDLFSFRRQVQGLTSEPSSSMRRPIPGLKVVPTPAASDAAASDAAATDAAATDAAATDAGAADAAAAPGAGATALR